MCTVIVEVPDSPKGTVRLLAVRDEDPLRPWDAPGPWWPETHPGVIGVRDRRANGAWLAAQPETLTFAVLLNRVETAGATAPAGGYTTRGGLVIDAVTEMPLAEHPSTAGFNLVRVYSRESHTTALVESWDGVTVHREVLTPGVHMLAHHDVDDAARTPRIAAWLPRFRELAGQSDDSWRTSWTALLGETTQLSADDDRAILRDNNAHGYPTQSLLVCLAEIGVDGMQLESAVLAEPASRTVTPRLQFAPVSLTIRA